MLNVLLAEMITGREKLIQVPSQWEPWQVFRHVRANHPDYCFVESWEVPSAVGEAIAA